jgi:hypothetical protein
MTEQKGGRKLLWQLLGWIGGSAVLVVGVLLRDTIKDGRFWAWLWAPSGLPNFIDGLALLIVLLFVVVAAARWVHARWPRTQPAPVVHQPTPPGPWEKFRGGIYAGRLYSWARYGSDGSLVEPALLCSNDGAALIDANEESLEPEDPWDTTVLKRCPDCGAKEAIDPATTLGQLRPLVERDMLTENWRQRQADYETELRRLAAMSKSTSRQQPQPPPVEASR